VNSISSYGDITTVNVGNKLKAKFKVPTDLLAIHWQYFFDAFDTWGRGEDVSLPKVTPSQFTNFVIWLHSRRTESASYRPQCTSENGYDVSDMYEG
jgi:hypothetical protein